MRHCAKRLGFITLVVVCFVGLYHREDHAAKAATPSLPSPPLAWGPAVVQPELDVTGSKLPLHIAFALTMRNVRTRLPALQRNIEVLGRRFARVTVVCTEEDSSDGTQEYLQQWQRTAPYQVLLDLRITPLWKWPQRLWAYWPQLLAPARNRYVALLQAIDALDYVIVVDADMILPWDVQSVLRAFELPRSDWVMIAANGVGPNGDYADLWAYRSWHWTQWDEALCTTWDCFRTYWLHTVKFSNSSCPPSGMVTPAPASTAQMYSTYPCYHPSRPDGSKFGPFIPVISAFGGFAIYRADALGICRYSSPAGDCEHVSFHKCLYTQHPGRLWIDTRMSIRWDRNTVPVVKR